jgi:23S rRNA (cytosine1962-C5)-methyltransferase
MKRAKLQSILTPPEGKHYQLFDSGNGEKVERFGNNTVVRFDGNCLWQPKANDTTVWTHIDAKLEKDAAGKLLWNQHKSFKDPWIYTYDQGLKEGLCDQKIIFSLKCSTSTKNIGIFPEQASNWEWMMHKICATDTPPNILNLFGYTGGATLCAAASGASVCHVDASQAAVTWAKKNQKLSRLEKTKIRWIVDDCSAFVEREVRRGVRYDALILDPPAFGRDQKGKVFEFEKKILKLLGLCKRALVQDPLFVIFNGYSMGQSATVLSNLLGDFFPSKNIEHGELHLQEQGGKRTLPCSIFARFSRD